MAIQKMSMVNIVGPLDEYDEIITNYILGKNLHVEHTLNVLDNSKDLRPFDAPNPYTEAYKKLSELVLEYGINPAEDKEAAFSQEAVLELVDKLGHMREIFEQEAAQYRQQQAENDEIIKQLEPLLDMDVDLSVLFGFEFIRIRFGKMPRDSFKKLVTYLDDMEAFFISGLEDRDYIWGVYFVPEPYREKVDRVFASLYFERIMISDRAKGTPREAQKQLMHDNFELQNQINKAEAAYRTYITEHADEISCFYQKLSKLYQAYELRRYGAHTKRSFYLVGWADEQTISQLQQELQHVPEVAIIEENAQEAAHHVSPPTKLHNNPLFRPFEFFVKMYGLPSYNEFDPTPIVAITYVLMFGIMFGDVGQGLVLAAGGFLLYKLKKMDLAAIIGYAGISSAFFGFCYGSVFGFEEVLHPWLLRPMENIMTVLIAAVALGTVIITLSMVLNIAVALKNRDYGRACFSQNGLAGLVFYWAVIAGVILMVVKGITVFSVVYNLIFIVLPLLLVFLREPLSRAIAHKRQLITGGKGEFFLESFFELFEILLSFVTNTISFVRVGAFALNHVGMMGVVFIFSEMASGAASWVIIVIGNLVVMGLEGLIVGIQVLRLEYYEIFSRFYSGEGKEFRSIKDRV